jgi:hypothetical protein
MIPLKLIGANFGKKSKHYSGYLENPVIVFMFDDLIETFDHKNFNNNFLVIDRSDISRLGKLVNFPTMFIAAGECRERKPIDISSNVKFSKSESERAIKLVKSKHESIPGRKLGILLGRCKTMIQFSEYFRVGNIIINLKFNDEDEKKLKVSIKTIRVDIVMIVADRHGSRYITQMLAIRDTR